MSLLRCLPCLFALTFTASLFAEDLSLTLRYQQQTASDSGRFHQLTRQETWKPEQTAIIVCDMWDLHSCESAVLRGQEFAPRLNDVLTKARQQGVTIIHAPSGCMKYYAEHPARQRAQQTLPATDIPEGITSWCYQIPAEEKGVYPVDQSDGGNDDTPQQHAKWAQEMESRGLNPRSPWTRQTELLTIDPDKDYISDQGDEVWSILAAGKIDNVILAGVHTNMCVLGRPFGLRQLAKNGKNVVLMRDMTDTMYNPKSWPFVSHFTGTDLIVSHIEKFVCPTVTSDQFLGGQPFRFKEDDRPHVVLVMAEDEYETNQTLPEFAAAYLGKDFRVSYAFGSATERNDIPGLAQALESADVVLLSVRRRALPTAQMEALRKFVAAGKPVIGIRTACHAFSLHGEDPPAGTQTWEKFDPEVFGGNYHGHHNNRLISQIEPIAPGKKHPILTGLPRDTFQQQGSLYKTAPLQKEAQVLLTGKIGGQPTEPVAWTFQRANGGRSFFTSLGHTTDFANPSFQRMLLNSVYWAAGVDVPEKFDLTKPTPPQKKI
ncbi:isochorismatase family protein [Bremerella cremea]|uniref:Isochorismatase family protein n=1 Tax=Bremerella cremea TaxID=1031537 RepID=A0A368KKY2_9BACT|nr:isochorismatase family protein [Bremerella cremea]RCS40460.1 isochorismatase family protein [Bremerella cremea]